MSRQTSQAIKRRSARLAQLTDEARRQLRAEYGAFVLTEDAWLHDLGVTFRADAAGAIHVYEHRTHAVEMGALRKDCRSGQFLASLVSLCGPRLGGMPEVVKTLSRTRNGQIRGMVRAMEKNRTARQRRDLARDERIRLEVSDMFRNLSAPRW